MTPEQRAAVDDASAGRNICLTGAPGSGKTFVIGKIVGALSGHRRVIVTGTTGASANVLNMALPDGVSASTLHAALAIPLGATTIDSCIKNWKTRTAKRRQRLTDAAYLKDHALTIIVDEASMLSPPFFEMVICYIDALRGNLPPCQWIIVMDPFQLGPVCCATKTPFQTENRTVEIAPEPEFCFETPTWERLAFACHYLAASIRCRDELRSQLIREVCSPCGITDYTYERCCEAFFRVAPAIDAHAPIACTSNAAVNDINAMYYSALTGQEQVYNNGDLPLRAGARVVLTVNISIRMGLCHGATGTVIGFDGGFPSVRFDSLHRASTIRPFPFETGPRIPLAYAWALTVHALQGCQMPVLRVESRPVEYGQLLVACTRAKITYLHFRPYKHDFAVHPKALLFMSRYFQTYREHCYSNAACNTSLRVRWDADVDFRRRLMARKESITEYVMMILDAKPQLNPVFVFLIRDVFDFVEWQAQMPLSEFISIIKEEI